MHTNNRLKKIIRILVICGALFGASQLAFAAAGEEPDKDTVVIGFIDSGIAPYNIDETHILQGKNYVFEDGDTLDRIGHGTKTAGLVLGSTDGSITGICPDAYVVPLVVVDKYASGVTKNGGTEALTAAIIDAVDVYECDIINISLSTTEDSADLKAAVDHANEKGVIIVCASGNNPSSESTYYPAHYDNVITVGSSDGNDIASFSSTKDADFFYEGKNVSLVSNKQGKVTVSDSGTSFSCACVSGICASWIYRKPDMSMYDMKAALELRCISPESSILQPFSETIYELSDEELEKVHCVDVEGLWCQQAVEFAIDKGLVTPGDDNLFMPDVNATRAVVVYALYQLSGAPEMTYVQIFKDVVEESWYSEAVTWAAESGIVSGYTSGNFGPDDNITREQLCTVFCKYSAYEGIELAAQKEKIEFVDQAVIADYAKEYVSICQLAGIVSGKPGNRFDPKGNATRAQLCAMLMNFVK